MGGLRPLFAGSESLVEVVRTAAFAGSITVQKLRGGISVLMGAGGNIAVLPGRDGKLLVDAGYVGARPKIGDALATISSDPIKQLVNTHWHFDHTDGNEPSALDITWLCRSSARWASSGEIQHTQRIRAEVAG